MLGYLYNHHSLYQPELTEDDFNIYVTIPNVCSEVASFS